MDESLFTHRPGNGPIHDRQVWVAGLVSLDQRQSYVAVVPDRTTETLQQIIEAHVQAGSTVFTDGWAAYNYVTWEDLDLQHVVTVHHAANGRIGNFQNAFAIEGYWSVLKRQIRDVYHQIPGLNFEDFFFEAHLRHHFRQRLRDSHVGPDITDQMA